jgi:glycine hydroxymethyltransferase
MSIKKYLTSDLGNRYATYNDDVRQRNYLGTKYIAEIEAQTHELVKEVFDCKCVDLRPLGGELAAKGVIGGLVNPGDVVMEHSSPYGGHGVGKRFLSANLTRNIYKLEYIPNNPNTYDVDLEALEKKVTELKPKLIICGRSKPLFFESLKEVRKIADKVGAYLAYDGAHIMGLVAGKAYPNPLKNGAHVLFGCTRKTFQAVQGGMILCNDEELLKKIRPSLYPALQTNHDASRTLVIAGTLLDIRKYGHEYMTQIVKNAKSLAKELESLGLKAIYPERDYTECHQTLLDVSKQGNAKKLALMLESAHIISGATSLPTDDSPDGNYGQNGIRIGVEEITKLGMKNKEMKEVARLLKQVLVDKEIEKTKKEVANFVKGYQLIHYSFFEGEEAFNQL